MTEEVWRPFGFDSDEQARSYDALHEGMPQWMEESFWAWVRIFFYMRAHSGPATFNFNLARECERVCRFTFGQPRGHHPEQMIEALRIAVGDKQLRLADFLIARPEEINARDRARSLEKILHESGSAWTVGVRAGRPGLVRRVPRGVQDAADHAIRTAGTAGLRLADAWTKAFGIGPDPSAAYVLAVRAVEDASIPVVVPKQADATLGHVIGQLNRDGDWSLPLTREDSTAASQSIVLAMCRALWKGHHDRHGGVPDAPRSVTQEEADTAVTIAVPLVHWFTSGMVARR